MKNGIKSPAMAVAAAFVLSGCGLLDVDNPNALVEESIKLEAASNGVANGSLNRLSSAVSSIWEGYLVTSDELFWIGSRDAWAQLDQGFISNPENEFTDAAFPSLGTGVWMAQNAVDILTEHVGNNPGVASFGKDLARAQLFNGIMLMVTGEVQEDMTLSNKQVDGAPIGETGMIVFFDRAITNLDAAVTSFTALGETTLATRARAVRARAHMSRAIWSRVHPNATVGGALAWPAAVTDANAVLASVGGSDWKYNLTYTATIGSCSMCGNVNSRKENQIDQSLVTLSSANNVTGIAINDPVSGVADLAFTSLLRQWKGGGAITAAGDQYSPLTIVSERLLRLIVAEDALAGMNVAAFEAQIDAIRDLDSEVAFNSGGAGMPTDLAMLQHTRRVNTFMMGLRLADMYRWGLTDPTWAPTSDAVLRPGSMLPITIVEIRANCHLNGQTCPTG
ncbi:MAG: hypothetical protein O2958_13415 [Gemmatimonadetes bacterium]|nr:hypothetical protein [Gemmatimonadota bacterium]